MAEMLIPPCVLCGKVMTDSFPRDAWPIPAVSGGTLFTSRGNYGSTLWDPCGTDDNRYLMAVICDECLIVLRADGAILIVTPPPAVREPPTVKVWAEGDD